MIALAIEFRVEGNPGKKFAWNASGQVVIIMSESTTFMYPGIFGILAPSVFICQNGQARCAITATVSLIDSIIIVTKSYSVALV